MFVLLTAAAGVAAGLLWYFGGSVGHAVVIGAIVYGIALTYGTQIYFRVHDLAKEKYPRLFSD